MTDLKTIEEIMESTLQPMHPTLFNECKKQLKHRDAQIKAEAEEKAVVGYINFAIESDMEEDHIRHKYLDSVFGSYKKHLSTISEEEVTN